MPSPDRRFTARRVVLLSQELSIPERLLYMLLDDFAGDKGECFPSRSTLAAAFPVSIRQLAVMLAGLRKQGFITSRKRQHTSAVYTLFWAAGSEVKPAALVETQKGTPLHFSMTPVCTSGSPHLLMNQVTLTKDGRTDGAEAIAWVIEALREYPGAQNLPGAPDEDVARRCLDVAGWDLRAIQEVLEHMHKVKRAVARQSWGYFPRVIGSYFQGAGEIRSA